MEIKVDIDESKATLSMAGKLTVQTSPDLSAALDNLPSAVCDIDIDLSDVDYIASAGLRVLVSADKLASKRGGTLRLLHPINDVMEVLDITGLSDVFTIDR